SREFGAETSSQLTASSATQSGLSWVLRAAPFALTGAEPSGRCTSVATMLPRICGLFLYTAALSFPLSDLVVGVGWLDGFAAGGSSSDRKSARPIRGPADWLCRGLVCRRRGLFHLRHWPHDWLWRYRAAAGARARTCDRDWCLRALPHGPHSGDCGLRHA